MREMTRRQVIGGLAVLGVSAVDVARVTAAQAPAASPELAWPPVVTGTGAPYPTQDLPTVKELVGASHNNLDRVKEILSRQPSMAKAAWDWGYGDWETALGAASHVGQRAIAEYLLEQGAPHTIFSATMLGELDVVKAMVAAKPGIQRTLGPHGLTLLSHARAGGAAAEATRAFLESVGGADERPVRLAITSEERARLVGTYRFGPGPRDMFVVDDVRDQLGIMRTGASRIFLHRTGTPSEWMFFPAGVVTVQIRFADQTMAITDGGAILTAMRV
jgi:hypothetical protein